MSEKEFKIACCTTSLQSQEKLCLMLGKEAKDNELKQKAYSCLESLRSLKSSLEGSDSGLTVPQLTGDGIVELKRLILMHIPSSLTDESRSSLTAQIKKAFEGQARDIISITLLTCPWWEASQRERGEQAKHNIVLVVFVSRDNQYFSAADTHTKEKASVIDLGWLVAVELSHFGQSLVRGRTRFIETVFCRHGAEVFSTPEWQQLRNNLNMKSLTGTKNFLEGCLGQAVGGIGKKKKTGDMKLKDGTSLYNICESLRLLQLADNGLRKQEVKVELIEENLSQVCRSGLEKLKSYYTHTEPHCCKQELFQIIISWKDELRVLAAGMNLNKSKVNQSVNSQTIGHWMLKTRLHGRKISPSPAVPDCVSRLNELKEKIGGPVVNFDPADILLVAVAGSAMYGLNTPQSDVDYLIVYRTSTQKLLSATGKLPESVENRGPNLSVEYGAYEARIFCEMLLKCSVVILELLFTEDHEYMSPLWQKLAAHKSTFVTEKAIQQYLGLVKNNFKFIHNGRYATKPQKERKLFYQIFHKLHSIEYLLRREIPPVKVSGEVKDFIMKVRTQEDKGEWSKAELLRRATCDYESIRQSLCDRKSRLQENPDFDLCTQWLLEVRGLV